MNTLSNMLRLSGIKYRVYDFGRSCQPVSAKLFEDTESGLCAYPHPFSQGAHLIIVKDVPLSSEIPGALDFNAIHIPLNSKKTADPSSVHRYAAYLARKGLDSVLGRSIDGTVSPDSHQMNWLPTWGESFMAQAHCLNSLGRSPSEHFYATLHGLKSNRIARAESDDFIWSDQLDIPEIGLAEVVVQSSSVSAATEALIHAVQHASIPLFESLCEFLTHISLSLPLIHALEKRASELMKLLPPGHSAYMQLIQSLAGSRHHEAMARIIDPILDQKVGGNPEILTRMVRYHRDFMAEHQPFEIDKVLQPAACNPQGMNVFGPYVADMIAVHRLGARIFRDDYGSLSPNVKTRLRELTR